MRTIAVALLVAAPGCNWVFGLQTTKLIDAAQVDSVDAPPDAVYFTFTLDHQIGTSDSSGPIAASYAAISPAPAITVGALGNATVGVTYQSDGTFLVPHDVVNQPWRLVYTISGDPVPSEVQWNVSGGHLTLPWPARANDTAPPTNSGYQVNPTGTAPTGSIQPMFVTSGAFTDSAVSPGDVSGANVGFHFDSEAHAVLGPLGTPAGAQGDWVGYLDWRLQVNTVSPKTTAYWTSGVAIAAAPPLTGGSLTPAAPTWVTTPASHSVSYDTIATQGRMGALVTYGASCCDFHLEYGMLASPNIAPFAPVRGSFGTNYYTTTPSPPPGLDQPLITAIYRYDNYSMTAPPTITPVEPPASIVKQPLVYYPRMTASRSVNGVPLASSFLEVTTTSPFTFDAPLALSATLGSTSLAMTPQDAVPFTAVTGLVTLAWTDETGHTADDYVVTLYQVTTSLQPIRRYHVFHPSAKIDGALLESGKTYVFGITARKGFPHAQDTMPDYSTVTLPFFETTMFPMAFIVN
jgi:hypothetical protein